MGALPPSSGPLPCLAAAFSQKGVLCGHALVGVRCLVGPFNSLMHLHGMALAAEQAAFAHTSIGATEGR